MLQDNELNLVTTIEPNSPMEIVSAVKTVCSEAHDATEAKELLAMLGLDASAARSKHTAA